MPNAIRGCLAATGLAAAVGAGGALAEPGYTALEKSLAVALFTALQQRSFELEAELCGYILRDAGGFLRMTGPYPGDEFSCAAPFPETGTVLASWHTHGSYSDDAYNELPSDLDVQSDAEEEIDGWIATPGGRLWFVDGETLVSTLICGQGCLPVDPAYDPSQTGPIAERYEFDALLQRLGL